MAVFALHASLLSGCELVSTGDDHERLVEGVSLTELFRPPTGAEIEAIEDEWAMRTTNAADIRIQRVTRVGVGGHIMTLKIISHLVGEIMHYGAVISPDGGMQDSRPVIVYAHGGDSGVRLDNEVLLELSFLNDIVDEFVYVVPSYRSEELRFLGDTWTSDGPPSPWDYDVDDALTLLSAADALAPTADLSRVIVLGQGRGAGVGLLMGIRDPRIVQVIEFFGPTDFFGPFIQDAVEEALLGSPRDLPGLNFLNEHFIQPVKNEELTIADIRPELIRRSPVLFVNRIPDLQIHHGTNDLTVPVGQAHSLINAMKAAGRTRRSFEWYLYQGGDHNLFSLPESLDRTAVFVSRSLGN